MEVTAGKIASYVVGVPLVLLGLVAALVSPVGGLVLLLAGLFALPIVRSKLNQRFDVSFSRWAVVGIVLVGFVVGVGGLVGTASDAPDNSAQNIPENDAETKSTQKGQNQQSQETNHGMSDTFTVGSGDNQIQYTVTKASLASNVGGQYGEDADGVFVIVEFEMENTGEESIDITSNTFKLVDSEGREYETDSDAMIYAEDSIVYEQLDPGVSKRGVVVFDVPEGQTGRRLMINPVGAFSTAESHYVELELE